MIEQEGYYRSLSDESLKARYNFDSEMQEKFKKLGLNLTEDLAFMKKEIRKRKLQKIHLVEFSDEIAEIEKTGAPRELISLLLDCQSKDAAEQIVNRVRYLHSLDPYWEENWFE
jgi:hypothetical protein